MTKSSRLLSLETLLINRRLIERRKAQRAGGIYVSGKRFLSRYFSNFLRKRADTSLSVALTKESAAPRSNVLESTQETFPR